MSVTMRFGLKGSAEFPAYPLQTRVRAAVRRCIADEIERLVDVLDALDGDTDFEETGDDEPSLGLPNPMGENHVSAKTAPPFDYGPRDDDRELDEAEGRQVDAGDEREADTCPCS